MDTNLQLETAHDARTSPTPFVNAGQQDWRLEASMLPGLALFVDAMVCVACGWLTWLIRFENFSIDIAYLLVIALLAMLQLNVMAWCGGYKLHRLLKLSDQVRIVALASAFTLFVALLLGFATKVTANYSRIFIASWFAASFVGLVGGRALLHVLIAQRHRTGRLSRRVLIVGTSALAAKMADHLRGNAREFSVIGFVSVEDMVDEGPRIVARGDIVGSVAEILDVCRTYRADLVLIALPWSDVERLDKVALTISVAPVDVRLGTPFLEVPFPNKPVSQLSGLPVIDLANRPFAGWSRIWKRLEDIFIASFALVLLSPVLLVLAVLVKLGSRGPIFFVQRRHGFANSEIMVYKFRTMRVESDLSQAQQNDPRVTRIGRILRRLSLDELPQLVNVLQGRMSLVGPRPHAIEHSDGFAASADRYFARHRVKPGITGWAQVNGLRGEIKTPNDIRRRIEFDIHYVERWSILFDLRILFRTVLIVFNSKNAY